MRVYLAQFLKRLDSVHLGHADVEDHHMVVLVLDLPQRLGGPFRGLNREGGGQRVGNGLPWPVFVVDNEHSAGLHSTVLAGGWVGDHQAENAPFKHSWNM